MGKCNVAQYEKGATQAPFLFIWLNGNKNLGYLQKFQDIMNLKRVKCDENEMGMEDFPFDINIEHDYRMPEFKP